MTSFQWTKPCAQEDVLESKNDDAAEAPADFCLLFHHVIIHFLLLLRHRRLDKEVEEDEGVDEKNKKASKSFSQDQEEERRTHSVVSTSVLSCLSLSLFFRRLFVSSLVCRHRLSLSVAADESHQRQVERKNEEEISEKTHHHLSEHLLSSLSSLKSHDRSLRSQDTSHRKSSEPFVHCDCVTSNRKTSGKKVRRREIYVVKGRRKHIAFDQRFKLFSISKAINHFGKKSENQ